MKMAVFLTFFSLQGFAFSPGDRVEHVKAALSSVKRPPVSVLENMSKFVDVLAETSCRAGFEGFKLKCLQGYVQQNCTTTVRYRQLCPLISDIVVVNKMNEHQFVSNTEKRSLLKSSSKDDYRVQYTKLLSGKYALLTTEFLLRSKVACAADDWSCLSKQLDDYCLNNSDVKNLPWQACVSAIVWFTGISR